MKNVIITGSNGMIGSLVLQYCLERDDVARATSITRKTLGITHPKLVEVIHQDFVDFSLIPFSLSNHDICFFCIGVYTGQVPKEEFRRITVDFTRSFATALKQNSPDVAFCFLSGQGADLSEKSKLMFARDKGVAENILINLHFKQLSIFRPGYIYPVTPRKEPNLLYSIFRRLYKPVLSKLFPKQSITSVEVAKAMVHAGFGAGDKTIYENEDIKRLLP
jgi:nucleoside-diphosphate-sugar epimerase